jgi:HlyD family secretion protein
MNKGCVISLVAVLSIFSVLLGYYFYQQSIKDPVVYIFEKPKKEDIVKKTVATGAVKPRQEVQVKPQVSGVVDALFVEAGEMVEKGQKIAKIKLVPSQVNINNAQSQVHLARIRYDEAQRELSRQQEVFNNKLDIEGTRAAYVAAKQEDLRNVKLLEEGVISQASYESVKRAVDMAKADFENAGLASKNSLKQFETNVAIAKQEMNAAINNLQLLQEGASRNSKQVNNVVTSTVKGMILDIPVEEGSSVIERNNFNEGTTIASVADMTSLIFEGNVDESDVGKLKEGMPLELTVGAIDEVKFEANLEYISPKGLEEEGAVKFEIRAAIKPNKEVFLRAGYSASGDIILAKREQVLTINERDVINEGDSTLVEIRTGDQEFEKKLVKLGLSDGILIEVLEGLNEETEVKVQKNL